MDENTSEALNNLISSIKDKMNESNNNNESSSTTSSTINLNLNNDYSNSSNDTEKENNNNNNNNNNSSSFDPELFIKIQKIMSAMNGNNPKKNLLLSLKPFLRQTRQDKINEYINILNIISALDLFKKGRD